jgi:hypothetical protein
MVVLPPRQFCHDVVNSVHNYKKKRDKVSPNKGMAVCFPTFFLSASV